MIGGLRHITYVWIVCYVHGGRGALGKSSVKK